MQLHPYTAIMFKEASVKILKTVYHAQMTQKSVENLSNAITWESL